ncbi:unnamed protein product [Brassica oleracea]
MCKRRVWLPTNVTCFAMQRHLHQCKYKSTLEGRRVCPFSGCSFIGTYHKLYAYASSGHYDDMQMIECGETMSISFANHQRVVLKQQTSTLSFARMIIARANSASSEPPPEPFVVPSFMGPATEKIEDITGETIVKRIEGDKEEGKPVREGHPDNPEEKNAGEDMEEELPLEGKGIDF